MSAGIGSEQEVYHHQGLIATAHKFCETIFIHWGQCLLITKFVIHTHCKVYSFLYQKITIPGYL